MNILIIGGGIASCHIIHQLLNHEVKITFLTDKSGYPNSSMIAGASLVPVNIRKAGVDVVDPELFQYIIDQYHSIESKLRHIILHPLPLKIFTKDINTKIHAIPDGIINHSFYLDIRRLLKYSLEYWSDKIHIHDELFDYKELLIKDKGLEYRGDIFDHVIFAEGIGVEENPFFQTLPFNENWGQVLILKIDNMDRNFMYHHHHRLLPIENDQWWYGARHMWTKPTPEQTDSWVEEQHKLLGSWLDVPFEIVKVVTHRRPTTPGQFPYIGLHTKHKNISIMNGLGSRGMMHAARYAGALSELILGTSTEIVGYDNKKFQSLFR